MIRYVTSLFLLSMIAVSCNSGSELSFSSEIFSEEDLAICKNDPCSSVSINFLEAIGDDKIALAINTKIEQQITDALFLGDDQPTIAIGIEEAAKQFVMAYRDHQPDLPSALDNGGYDATIQMNLLFQNNDLVFIENNTYTYTGGAHGLGVTTFLNFDVSTGELVDVEDWVTNIEALETLVEKKFRAMYKIETDGSLNEKGFWFEDDLFYLSTNVALSKEALLVIYNPYEIAPYGSGQTVVEIGIEEVAPFLNTDVL